MANTFFTADQHWGHASIIRYCKRPFLKSGDLDSRGKWVSPEIASLRCHKMNKLLTHNWNERVKPEDTVYHLGDFCYKGKSKFEEYASKLNGNLIITLGNHDGKNGVKSKILSAILKFKKRLILIQHLPPVTIGEIPPLVSIVLCGHVHNAWKHKVIGGIPIVNVGVDVWDFKPVTYNEILAYLNRNKLI